MPCAAARLQVQQSCTPEVRGRRLDVVMMLWGLNWGHQQTLCYACRSQRLLACHRTAALSPSAMFGAPDPDGRPSMWRTQRRQVQLWRFSAQTTGMIAICTPPGQSRVLPSPCHLRRGAALHGQWYRCTQTRTHHRHSSMAKLQAALAAHSPSLAAIYSPAG